MLNSPRVHIVSIDTGLVSPHHYNAHFDSLNKASSACNMGVTCIKYTPTVFGGTFLNLINEWQKIGAEYVCYVPTSFVLAEDTISRQIAFMDENKLAGSYGDVSEVNNRNDNLVIEKYKNFSVEMLGFDTVPTETMMIRRASFESIGGFDHAISGSCSPNIYLVTMTAIAGKIMKLNEILRHRHIGDGQANLRGSSLLCWDTVHSRDVWGRFRIDKFTSQARTYYKEMGW